MNSSDKLEERKELIQDVIDRVLYNPEYKEKLIELNNRFPVNCTKTPKGRIYESVPGIGSD